MTRLAHANPVVTHQTRLYGSQSAITIISMNNLIHTETQFEEAVVAMLTGQGWIEKPAASYRADVALDVDSLVDFLRETQPKAWAKYVVFYKDEAEKQPGFPAGQGTRLARNARRDPTGDHRLRHRIQVGFFPARPYFESRGDGTIYAKPARCHASSPLLDEGCEQEHRPAPPAQRTSDRYGGTEESFDPPNRPACNPAI